MYHCDGNDYDYDPVTGCWVMEEDEVEDEVETLQGTEEYSAELKKYLDEVLG